MITGVLKAALEAVIRSKVRESPDRWHVPYTSESSFRGVDNGTKHPRHTGSELHGRSLAHSC